MSASSKPKVRTGWLAAVAACVLLAAMPIGSGKANAAASGDAYVNYDSATRTWTVGTGKVEKAVRFGGGTYTMTRLVNKATGRNYVQGASPNSDEFNVKIGTASYNGSGGGWIYDSYRTQTLAQGELQLSVVIHNNVVEVTRHYVAYPSTGVIEEWSEFRNISGSSQSFADISAFRQRVMQNDAGQVDLYVMSGDKADTPVWNKLLDPKPATANTTFAGNGSNKYHPFLALYNRTLSEGIFVTWDYTGNWLAEVGDFSGRTFAQVKTSSGPVTIANNATLKGPLSRTGVFSGDLDDMGNTILDFTYRYKWDYTREEYFPLVRFGGYGSDPAHILNKIHSTRYIGGDLIWIDAGWQDYLGDWNNKPGESNAAYNAYAVKNGQKLGLWLVPWGAEANSQIAAAHPEWMANPSWYKAGLRTERQDVVAHILAMLNQKQTEFGSFMLKTDYGADSGTILKANNILYILEQFKKQNPGAALLLCSDGAGLLSIETARFSDVVQLRDGAAGSEDGYYTSLLFPSEKLQVSYGRGDIGNYSKSNRYLLSYHLTIAGKVDGTPSEMEPLRRDVDLYRYLKTQGVMGRWVKVYRPAVSAGDKEGILQKMSGDGSKGYITFAKKDAMVGTNVTVFPKGLNASASYTVATLEGGKTTETRNGSYWMTNGIPLTPFKQGEVIFFNLENRPMSGSDTTAPSAPGNVSQAEASNLGYNGIEVTWTEGADDNWISYYEIFKNGAAYDKVSKGTYYFDKEGVSGDEYQVRTVDGDGNVSALAPTAVGPANVAAGKPATADSVYDVFAAEKAVDGVVSDESRWVSANTNGPHWLEVDLGQSYAIGSAEVHTGHSDGNAVSNFKLQAWNGSGWTDIPGASASGNPKTSTVVSLAFADPVATSKVRFVSTDNGYVRVKELKLFAL